jgi:hypothetical protein
MDVREHSLDTVLQGADMPAGPGKPNQTSSRTIFVVFAAAAQQATGAQLAQQIVAILEEQTCPSL